MEAYVRCVEMTGWLVPADVWVEGDWLCWTEVGSGVSEHRARQRTGRASERRAQPSQAPTAEEAVPLLEDFVMLGDASASEIEAFAKTWGPLRLCEHGWPTTLAPVAWSVQGQVFHDRPVGDPHPEALCLPKHRGPGFKRGSLHGLTYMEALDDWRRWATMAKAVLETAAALTGSGRPSLDDLRFGDLSPILPGFRGSDRLQRRLVADVLGTKTKGKPENDLRPAVNVYRELLGTALDRWAELGGVRSHVSWFAFDRPSVTLGQPMLFSGLAQELLANAGSVRPRRRCRWCSGTFEPRRSDQRLCGSEECKKRDRRERVRLHRRRKAVGQLDSS